MGTLTLILLVAAAASFVMYGLAIWSTVRHHRLPIPDRSEAFPPISLLKPIKGLEEELEQNLRSFFEQDYPAPIEIVFASSEEGDPGMEVAARVAAEHPGVPVKFVRSDAAFGLNPKVSNLAGALRSASHDLVLQSDANVRARPDYLRRIVSELLAQDGSLLSSMVTGVGEESFGAALENLQLTAYIGPATCTALHVAGVACVIGKSMLFRRSELESLGGLEYVRDILCEDFILGQRYEEAGKKVILSATTVQNVNRHTTFRQFLSRHSRWLKMQVVIHLGSFFATLLANPVGLGFAAFLVSGFDPTVGSIVLAFAAIKIAGDAFLVRLNRGTGMRPAHLLLDPLRDVVMLGVWLYSCFSRSVTWRGKKLRFGRESRLRPDDGKLPVRVARRLRDSVANRSTVREVDREEPAERAA